MRVREVQGPPSITQHFHGRPSWGGSQAPCAPPLARASPAAWIALSPPCLRRMSPSLGPALRSWPPGSWEEPEEIEPLCSTQRKMTRSPQIPASEGKSVRAVSEEARWVVWAGDAPGWLRRRPLAAPQRTRPAPQGRPEESSRSAAKSSGNLTAAICARGGGSAAKQSAPLPFAELCPREARLGTHLPGAGRQASGWRPRTVFGEVQAGPVGGHDLRTLEGSVFYLGSPMPHTIPSCYWARAPCALIHRVTSSCYQGLLGPT